MAQYYNFVTNASGTLTLEEVQRFCFMNGQSVQFIVEDKNNSGNGSPQVLTYTTVPQNNQQAIISQQTVNLRCQIPPTQLEQGQNVFIIKTNEISGQQAVLKSTAVSGQPLANNIVNFVDSAVVETNPYFNSKTLINCNNGAQSVQWMKMQENISSNTISKQNVVTTGKIETANINRNYRQSHTPASGQRDLQEVSGEGTKRKPLRLQQSKNSDSTINTQAGNPSGTSAGVYVTTVTNSNESDTGVSAPAIHNKADGPGPQNVTRNLNGEDAMNQMRNSPRQMQNDHRLQQSPIQRNASNTHRQSLKTSVNNSPQRQPKTPAQQRQSQTPTIQVQGKQFGLKQTQSSRHMHNSMDRESHESDNPEKNHDTNSQMSPASPDSENNATESFAILQKIIDNPGNTIVQHQIPGRTAKMLVILYNGEQRLITFDIPNEDCTVQDLLEQANITFCGETSVSLVSDPTLGINYIVEAGAGSTVIGNVNDLNDANALQENCNSSNENSCTTSSPDENINPMQQNEEASYIEGMLAVCSHCGFSSPDFNRCLRCKTKLPKDVKSVPMACVTLEKKQNMSLSVDMFFKKHSERNLVGRMDRDGTLSKRGRGRGRGGATKSRVVHKEPECLTISSDEDEDGKSKKEDNFDHSMLSSNASNSFSEEMETILEKEPVITNNSISSTNNDYTPTNEEMGKDNPIHGPFTSLLCRTVRIGSYKYIPQEKICFTSNGIRFGVPLLEDDKTFVKLDIKYTDVVKILVHFGKATPVLFIYTTTNTGAMIREVLGMQDPKGPYYDPIGKDFTHKRITLLPEKLTEESKIVLKNLFSSRNLLEELNSKEANDLLVKASPKDGLQLQSLTSRRQSQSSFSPSVNNTTNSGIQKITVYPAPPAKGGIAINTEDYLCLGEDQFLNDVIIDFYLKYLTLEVLSETDQQRTHVFSSYFYKRLTSPHTQAVESNVPLSPAAKRHARVQKWTKNVNIFEKDFIIIPINEHAHWFLAIICFPGLVGTVPLPPSSPPTENDIQSTIQKSKKLKEVKLQAVTIGNTTITPVITTITIDQIDDSSERDEAEGDDEEMEMESDDDEQATEAEDTKEKALEQTSIAQGKDSVKVPCILIFDSLAGASRARVVATLRDYLSCEHIAKMGVEKVFSKDTIKGASLKVPQQSNFTDCGLYVLQYVESFFKDPIKDYTLPIKTLKNWFEEIVVTRKREDLSKLLIKLMNATRGDKNITLPTANFPTQDGILKPKPESNTEGKPAKPDLDNKKKTATHTEIRVSNNMPITTENSEQESELFSTTTYSLIPYSPSTSSNSSESNQTEGSNETTSLLPRSSSDTMTYLRSKRIARLVRVDNHEHTQGAKKHKGESFNSCK